MHRPHFIYSFVDGHLDCFHFSAVENNAITNICIPVSVQVLVFYPFRYISRSEGAGLCGMLVLNLIKIKVNKNCFP